MGYCDDPAMVRVDFFKDTGKWYATEAVDFTGCYGGRIDHAIAKGLVRHLRRANGSIRFVDMVAVILEPHHEHAHPWMVRVGAAVDIAALVAQAEGGA